jgi:hypothetical protein
VTQAKTVGLIYYGAVHVGTIAVRSGIPHNQAPWGWRCGFYPGSEPGECSLSLDLPPSQGTLTAGIGPVGRGEK